MAKAETAADENGHRSVMWVAQRFPAVTFR
jgi:hypothetical protein